MIDGSIGAPCVTYSALSAFDDLDAAIENLRHREDMPTAKRIGFTVTDRSRQSARAIDRHPHATRSINAWANANGLDAAIWTALESNFTEKAHGSFFVEASIRYLETRNGEILDAALTYIRRTPPEVQSPVREAVNIAGRRAIFAEHGRATHWVIWAMMQRPPEPERLRRNIYIDVDGVCLRNATLLTGIEPAPYVFDFLRWAVMSHRSHWLTTRDAHGQHDGISPGLQARDGLPRVAG